MIALLSSNSLQPIQYQNLERGFLMDVVEELGKNWKSEENFPEQFGDASIYARKMAKRPLSYFADRVKNMGISGHRVLDAGCGTGNWSFGLTSTFDEVHAIDYVKERADLCNFISEKYQIANTHFAEGNVLETGFPDEYFDAVFCFGVIIVPQTPLKVALEEFRRVVKPGGEIFVCLNAPGWAHYLASAEAEARSNLGKKGLYANLRKRLADVPAQLAADPKKRQAIADEQENGVDAILSALVRECGATSPIEQTLSQMKEDCGDTYLEMLAKEVVDIATGDETEFAKLLGYPSTYTPEETAEMAKDLNLEDFTWAAEGRLVRAENPVEVKPIYAGYFGEQLANWEFVVRRGA